MLNRGRHIGHRSGTGGWRRAYAFTLVELLIAIAILSVLLSLLLPVAGKVWVLANVTKAKAEMRGIATALLTYHMRHRTFPPARTYCDYGAPAKAADWAELPPELGEGYFGSSGDDETVDLIDPFNPGRTYKYLAPGRGYHNGVGTYISFWVPDNFPRGDNETGKDYSSAGKSPVSFVLWSVGPGGDIGYWNALSKHHPFDTRAWFGNNNDEGIVFLGYMKNGEFVFSP